MQNQREPKKDFSILKWIIFPSTSLILAAIIVWFNITVFGWRDGAPYIGIAAAITFFAICIVKYSSSENRQLVAAAFLFEMVLLGALIVNAAYSLSVQREMSIANQNKLNPRELRGLDPRAQRNMTRNYRGSNAIFKDNESMLFWIFVGEMIAYGVAAFTIYGISQIFEKKNKSVALSPAPGGGGTRYQDRMDDRWASKSPAMSPAPVTAQDKPPK